MEEKEISVGLIRRMKRLYEDMEVSIRSKERMTRRIRVKKGVKQGCVISPVFFNLYMANIDHEMKKEEYEI